jgi:ribosomal protein S18 acetylase RimI-like enzyme
MKEMNIMVSIRRAKPTDAKMAVPLIMDAIGNIAEQMTGETEIGAVEQEMISLFKREDNRHSYLNTWIAEKDSKVIGVMVFYKGSEAIQLDANLVNWLQEKTGKPTVIPPEAYTDEYYIDTVCINPEVRGQGLGSLLFKHAEVVAREEGIAKLALNVELEKESVIRLYERLGYQIAEPWVIYGGNFHHMTKKI